MRWHRPLILALMTVLAVALLATMVAGAVGSWDAHSAVALAVVVVAAAIGGIAFSWRRYFGKRT
jgi:CDP-diglyceride synthetase